MNDIAKSLTSHSIHHHNAQPEEPENPIFFCCIYFYIMSGRTVPSVATYVCITSSNEATLFVSFYLLVVHTMGRIFLDHIGGTRLFSCANCDTILTNRAELISTRFTGATGRAFLFNKVPAHDFLHLLSRLTVVLYLDESIGPRLKHSTIHLKMMKGSPSVRQSFPLTL